MSDFGEYPLYSVDASVLIDIKDRYPREVFVSLWSFLEALACDGRFLVQEEADGECHDQVLRDLLDGCPDMVVGFGVIQDHFKALQADLQQAGLRMVDPGSTRDKADPFVVGLALALDGRAPASIQRRLNPDAKCIVVTHEKRAGAGAQKLKIPDVCKRYGLDWIDFVELLIAEGHKE